MSGRERVVTFQGHHSYIVSIARLCKQNGLFTDVTLQCDDGKLLAHRIVLAAVSPFLRGVLIELPSGTQDFTIIVPDVRRAIVQQLLDFLYTGNMNVEQEATWELQELVHLLKIDPSNVGVVVDDDGCASRLASNGICETVGVKIATRAELPAGSRLPVSSPHPTPALPRLTIKTEHQQTPHHLTNGLHRPPPAKSPPSRPATRPKPLSSRPDYVESPPHSPVHHQAPHSLTKKLSSPGRGGSKAGAVSPASSRLVSHTGQTASTRGGHAATNGGRPAHSPGTRPNSNGPRGGSVKALTAKPRVARPEESGDSRVVVGPAESSNVINNQESLKIKISLTNRKRRMSSDTPSSSPSYSSSLSPGSRVSEPGSVKKWSSGEGASSMKNRLNNEAGSSNGKRGRGVRTRGRARGRGGEGRGGGGRGARGLHDWENSRTWVCAICGQYDPVAAAGATTEWIGCDCNRWFHKFCTKLKSVGDDFSCGQVHKVCLSS